MDEVLSEPSVGSPTAYVVESMHSETTTAAASDPTEDASDRANVEIRCAPEGPAGPLQSGGEPDLTPSLPHHVDAPKALVWPADTPDTEQQAPADVLHVGCGVRHSEKLPLLFRNAGWREIRLDIDPDVEPDVVASITNMRVISDSAVDAVYSSHNVEHLYPHEVPLALREMTRVLKPDGFAFIKLPDLQEVARHVADGKLEDPLYLSPMGEIAPLDILFGHRPSLAQGNTFMAHRTGFTATTLATALIAAGFAAVMVQRDVQNLALTAIAFRSRPDAEQILTWQVRLVPTAARPTVLYAPNG